MIKISDESDEDIDKDLISKVKFLHEELDMSINNKIRYSPQRLVFSAQLYFSYPAAYKMLRGSGYLKLPHPKT